MPGSADVTDVIIVGAGAAGLATAIFLAKRRPDLKVVALDGAKQLGAKILVSGGGRCNVTNSVVTEKDFFGGNDRVIRHVLRAFSVTETIAFFREIGVELREEAGGKLFPSSNRARTVLDALLGESRRRGVEIRAGERVVAVEKANDGFAVATTRGTWRAKRVVLATGGLSLPKSGSDGGGLQLAVRLGHALVPATPALVPLVLDGDFHVSLSGVSHPVALALHVAGTKPVRLVGSLLWTHFGVSGPVILNASRIWHRATLEGQPVRITANLVGGRDFEQIEEGFLALTKERPRARLQSVLAADLPRAVAVALLERLAVDPRLTLSHLAKADRRKLLQALTAWPLPVKGSRGYSFAEVTAGGVTLGEIDPATLVSRRCPGLYLVGEILDVDGRIGGFNFQWSWSSAWVAASALALAL